MTMATQPEPRPELGSLDKLFLTGGAKAVLGWQEKQIRLLESRIVPGSRAYDEMNRWVQDHGGPEIVENEEALARSGRHLAKVRRDLETTREEVAQFRVALRVDSAGDFDRAHPAQDAIALSGELRDLRTEIKGLFAVRGE